MQTAPPPSSPPAQEPRSSGAWVTAGTRPMSWLGQRIDGWADLLDNMGDRAPDVVQALQQNISSRGMPGVTHESSSLTTGTMGAKQRVYHLSHRPTGAAAAVYVGKFGRDLYLSWELCIRPVWNRAVLMGIAGSAAVLAFLFAQQRNPLTGRSIFSLELFLGATIFFAVIFAFAVSWAGNLMKHDPMAFFFKEIDRFEADDISAMTLGVHKSVQQAADAIGFDVQLLRAKTEFRGGRRDRLI